MHLYLTETAPTRLYGIEPTHNKYTGRQKPTRIFAWGKIQAYLAKIRITIAEFLSLNYRTTRYRGALML